MADDLIPLPDLSDGDLPVWLDPTKASSVDGHWSSIDQSTETGKIDAVNAMVGAALKGCELVNTDIPVRHVMIHVVQLSDLATGEMTDAPRVLLIDPDGIAVSFVSMGVVTSLKKIIQRLGAPPWNPPLLIKPIKQRTRKGFETIILTVTGRVLPTTPPS